MGDPFLFAFQFLLSKYFDVKKPNKIPKPTESGNKEENSVISGALVIIHLILPRVPIRQKNTTPSNSG